MNASIDAKTAAAATVSTAWAAQRIGRSRDTVVRTLLTKHDLSFASERRDSGVPDGELSWWEMVRLEAYEHLKSTRSRDNHKLRGGLLLLRFDLDPFLIVWSQGLLPVSIRPDQLVRYQMDKGTTGAFDPEHLLAGMGLAWTKPASPGIMTGREQVRRPRVRQPELFPSADQLDLFHDGA